MKKKMAGPARPSITLPDGPPPSPFTMTRVITGSTVGYGAYDTWNPVASAVEPDIDRPTYKNNLNLSLNFNILEGLSLRITGGVLMTNINHREYYNKKTKAGTMNNGFATLDNAVYETWQNSNILTYDNNWGSHHLTVTGVVEQIYSRDHSTHTTARDFLVDQLGFNNIGGAGKLQTGSYASERSLLSYMGRINYALLNRYLLTFTYRADGSSVFGADNKWGYFRFGCLETIRGTIPGRSYLPIRS